MSQDIDYDKQFQADLERAQALSLESLALEKFRMKKKLEKLQAELQKYKNSQESSSDDSSSTTTPVSFSRQSSETTQSRTEITSTQIKSRPRPGSFNVGQTNPIIAPPPTSQRRNSSTSSITSADDTDLISFTSPTQSNATSQSHESLRDIYDQIHRLTQQQSEMSLVEQTPPPPPPKLGINLSNLGTPTGPVPYQSNLYPTVTTQSVLVPSSNLMRMPPPPSYGFQPHITAGLNLMGGVAPLNVGYRFPAPVPQVSSLVSTNFPPRPPPRVEPPKLELPPITTTPPTAPVAAAVTNNTNTSNISNSSSIDVFKAISKQDNSNLIDLASNDRFHDDKRNNVRVSVLEIFDPLLITDQNSNNRTVDNTITGPTDDAASECSGSMYNEYDPFDYLYTSGSGAPSVADPIYAAVVRSDKAPQSPQSPPPLPPRAAVWSTLERKRKSIDELQTKKKRLYENITVVKRNAFQHDSDLRAFYTMVKDIRGRYLYDDPETNQGVVISPMIKNVYRSDTSIKLVVHPMLNKTENQSKPISFTCDVSCSIEHVILHVLCELDQPPEIAHRLEVWGAVEYLAPGTCLADYEYVHHCIKLEQDVVFSLVPESLVDRSLSRTAQDDRRDMDLTLDDLLPNEPGFPISHEKLKILLETIEREMERLEVAAVELTSASGVRTSNPTLHSNSVVQSVKAVCTLMGMVETSDISEAVEKLCSSCTYYSSLSNDYNALKNEIDLVENIKSNCDRIRAAIQGLIEMYCQAFRVDFELNYKVDIPTATLTVSDVIDTILIHVCALHRVPSTWKHNDYLVAAQVYHGTRPVGHPILSVPVPITMGFYPRILFNSWLDMEGISVCQLARESRIVLVLYGRTIEPSDNKDKDDVHNQPTFTQEELGWAAIQFFDYNGMFTQGNLLVSLWPSVTDKRLGPAPCSGAHPLPDHPLLSIELPSPGGKIMFPSTPPQSPNNREPIGDFACLDENTQQQLLDIVEMDIFNRPPVECREVLWEKRHYLRHLPEALPKVLLAAHSWDWACLANLHYMVHNWTPMPPVHALQLLLPCFPDIEVRRCAVNWIQAFTNDELVDILPQLVQALKHETYEASALARLLLERSLTSPRVAHNLYWLLMHSLPGSAPQNSQWDNVSQDEFSVGASRHYRRLMLLLRALLAISGEAQRCRFMSQQLLVKSLNEVAETVKSTKESLRLKALLTNLEPIHQTLIDNPTSLPLSPSLLVNGIQVRTCSYFASNTLPLRINFLSPSNAIIPAIFKVGDDLQQDMLTLQVVRIMDKLWLGEGLDLKMVAFGCVPTSHKRGMIELVGNAEPLRKIQIEWGLTGSFKDKPIAEWLARHNPSELEYERAVENFTASCAGYSVVTYILGICDRHNDNIMLKTSGHVFHIDFGKFLGDAQMFGNFKRDRTPFVLTSDMAYVINGGDRPSARFHKFVDLCCQAYNIVRKHGNLILHLFALMASSGIPGVTMEAVNYVRRALLPGQSNAEAAATFARLIESSLKSWFTQFNFFLHNLAQLRFTGDHGDGELLSFVPRVYSMATDGRLISVEVQGYQKRYDPDKHYLFIIKVERVGNPDASYVLRSYREFTEFYQKLCLHFPLAKIHSLPTGIHMGRSNIKQVAAKRKIDIELFLKSLFQTADEIAHSDLVYTFFHPLLRDQQPVDLLAKKLKDRRNDQRNDIGRVKGELKLSLIYERGALCIMVQHARSLPLLANGQEPSTYVKVYLQPDPSKATKRKTKVVRRSCHPTFMEMLEYRLPIEVIRTRVLQATIWSYDPLQENEFLGGVEIRLAEVPLEREENHWFPLVNITR